MTQGHFKVSAGFKVDSVAGRITVVSYRNTRSETLIFPWQWQRVTLRNDRPPADVVWWEFFKGKSVISVSFPIEFPP